MKLHIDGLPVTICRWEQGPHTSGWYRLFIKPEGHQSGPTSQHDIPRLSGSFRTNGHTYKFICVDTEVK